MCYMTSFRSSKLILMILTISASIFAACSSSDNKSLTPATDLSKEIDKLIADGDFDKAQSLIDTLNIKYPDSLEQRRTTIGQMAQIAEGVALKSIPEADARIANAQSAIDSLSQFFNTITTSEATGSYLLEKSQNINEMRSGKNAIQPRVSDDDMPWMLAVTTAKIINPYSIKLINHAGQTIAVATNPSAESATITSGGTQILIFTPEQSESIAEALTTAPDLSGYSISVIGKKGNVTIPLNTDKARAIVRSRDLANARNELKQALIKREGLERRLLVARNQSANNTAK